MNPLLPLVLGVGLILFVLGPRQATKPIRDVTVNGNPYRLSRLGVGDYVIEQPGTTNMLHYREGTVVSRTGDTTRIESDLPFFPPLL